MRGEGHTWQWSEESPGGVGGTYIMLGIQPSWAKGKASASALTPILAL